MELTLKQLTDLFTISAETLMDYKEKAEDVLGMCECQFKAMPIKDFGMTLEGLPATFQPAKPSESDKHFFGAIEAMLAGERKREPEPTEPEPTEPTEAPKIAPQSEEKPAVDKLPEAPKEEQNKPIFKIKPAAEIGSGGKGGHTSYPAEEDPKPLQPSDLLEPEPSEGGRDKKKLDDGKICALRRAGWTWDKIADEMHCSAQTALNHYNAYIRKMGKE